MARGLDGLSVVLTGAGSGIGRQVAHDLHRHQGVRLTLLDRDQTALQRVGAELGGASDAVRTLPCDIGSQASIDGALAALDGVAVDVLINCAGVVYAGAFESMPLEQFEWVLNVNLLGAVRLTRLLLPRLLNSPRATVVNVASLAGLVASPGMAAYSASKFGLVGFSEALQGELHGRVRVCTVCPSLVRTGFAKHAHLEGDGDPAARNRQLEWMDSVMEKLGSDPARVSRAILKAIESGQELVVINPDAHFLYYLKRLLPAASERVARSLYHRLAGPGAAKR